jgi:hypothetical protein
VTTITIKEGADIPVGFPQDFDSVLDALERENILKITQDADGFDVREGCDKWFWVLLSPDQLRLLGEELIALSSRPFSEEST